MFYGPNTCCLGNEATVLHRSNKLICVPLEDTVSKRIKSFPKASGGQVASRNVLRFFPVSKLHRYLGSVLTLHDAELFANAARVVGGHIFAVDLENDFSFSKHMRPQAFGRP